MKDPYHARLGNLLYAQILIQKLVKSRMIPMSRTALVIALALIMLDATTLHTTAQSDQTKDIAFDITGLFEGGKPDSLQTIDDGIVSYGIHQATLASGSLYNVVKRYTEISQTPISEQMVAYLPRIQLKDSSLRNDATFLKLLKDAAGERAMAQAQNEIFSKNYYEPARQKAVIDGVASALGIAIYYDTNIQGGLEPVRRATSQHFSQGDFTEQEWLYVFLEERRNYLLAVSERKRLNDLENDARLLESAASVHGRVGILQDLVEAGNLDLNQGDAQGQISMGKFGSISVIDSDPRAKEIPILTSKSKTEDATTAPGNPPLQSVLHGLEQITKSLDQSDLKQPGFGTINSESTGFGVIDSKASNSVITQKKQTLGEIAVENAKKLSGLAYGFGGKGFDYNSKKLASAEEIKTGYKWYNADKKFFETSSAIDCSGLVSWAFDTAAGYEAPLDKENTYAGLLWTKYNSADYTRDSNKYVHSSPPDAEDLNTGDLLFLNTDRIGPGQIDHVAMYAGKNNGVHEVIESAPPNGVHIIPYEEWLNKYEKYFAGYGRVTGAENPVSTSDLGGINFTSIRLNSIAVSDDGSGGVNFDLILKAQKADSSIPGIDLMNSSSFGATAFMTGLVVPDSKFWVNLNPWEPDRIIDHQLNRSEVGRIMLEADLQMKRDLSNYVNPCANETGKALWILLEKKHEALVQQCMNKFPGEIKDINNIRFHTVTKQWIVPDKIYAFTNGTEIYIINASLTINSESWPDRSSFLVDNQEIGTLSKECLKELNKSAKEFGEYVTELKDRLILPYVVSDVNHEEKYESLRDIYVAIALAQWYKSKITSHNDIFREFRDSPKSTALESMKPWSSYEIWEECVSSFKNGEYKCWINETINTASGPITKSRSYSSGGVDFYNTQDHLVEIEEIPPSVRDLVTKAIQNGFTDEEKDVSFGIRLHADKKEKILDTDTISSSSSEQEVESHSSTCPEGWTGPDENGECWKMQIITD